MVFLWLHSRFYSFPRAAWERWVHRAAVLVLRRGTWEPVGGNFLVPAKPGEESSGEVISPLLQLGLGGGGRPSKHAVNTSMYARRRLAALRNPATLARPALTVHGEGVRRLRRLTHAADGFADLPPPPLLTCR